MPASVQSLDLTHSIHLDIQVNPLHSSRTITDLHLDQRPESRSNAPSASLPSTNEELVVPKSERRGILSRVVLIPEYRDAREYPSLTKYIIVFVIAFALITGPMGSLIMLPAIEGIVRDLDTSDVTVNVSVGIYLISLGIFPLWWSSLSERSGRRTVYVISFTMFFAFSIGTALAPTIGALIGLRVLQGGCSASVQAVGAGTIGDLFTPDTRGRAMGWYYLGPLGGPFLAPILGGAVAQGWGWRATQWLLVIFSGCNALLIIFLLPETLRNLDSLAMVREMLEAGGAEGKEAVLAVEDAHEKVEEESLGLRRPSSSILLKKVVLRVALELSQSRTTNEGDDDAVVDSMAPSLARLNTHRSAYSRQITARIAESELLRRNPSVLAVSTPSRKLWLYWRTTLYDVIVRPLHALVILTHPPVALVIAFLAVIVAIINFFNMTISYEYSRPPYDMSSVIVGLLYIPNSVAYVVALILGGRWTDYLLRKHAKQHNGELSPELRISWNVVLAVALCPPACLIFGWCLDFHEHWVTPLIGSALIGFSLMLVIGAIVTYLVDSLPGKGATGVALNNMFRQVLGAVATFVVEPALRGIGPGILFSILTGIVLVGSSLLVVLKWKGSYFRENFDLAKLYEKL